jgi:hypothetical protein
MLTETETQVKVSVMSKVEPPAPAIRLDRRAFLTMISPALLRGAAEARVLKHVLIYREKGRFGGWPANHGIWSWGNEILVGFSAGYFKQRRWMYHQADPDKPEVPAFARSLDGGESWTVQERPEQLLPRWGGKPGAPLAQAVDFAHPDLAMTLRFNDVDKGPTIYWYSLDRGHNWSGPFEFPSLGLKGIPGRTDYLVFGKQDALIFLTAAKSNGEEGRPFCARTRDGGLHWEFVSYIGEEPAGFAIMPSSLALPGGTLITTVRRRETGPGPGQGQERSQRDWIDAYTSTDEGKTWTPLVAPVEDTGRGGSPPALVRLADGRLCVAYGYRSEPYSIRARLSSDGGRSWGPEIFLRRGGKAPDLGYPRSAVRPDGKIVTVYYFNDDVHNERFIEAVVWVPGAA